MTARIRLAFACLIGVAVGAVGTAVLSKAASVTFVNALRLQYAFDEHKQAAAAGKRDDWESVIRHAENSADADTGQLRALSNDSPVRWALTLPADAIILRKIESASSDGKKNTRAWLLGAEAAVKGLANEKLGREEQAQGQYTLARQLIGSNDSEDVREIARHELGLAQD